MEPISLSLNTYFWNIHYARTCAERIHRKVQQDLYPVGAYNVINNTRKLNIGSVRANKKGSYIKQVVKKRFMEKVIPERHYKTRI